jgi:hypothetical protein
MMNPGQYYVGDLCYILEDRWDEVCDIICTRNEGGSLKEGEFTLLDGTKFAVYRTKWGDGIYQDQNGKDYPVDAGIIGCIAVKDIMAEDQNVGLQLGQVFDFKFSFNTAKDDSVIRFAQVLIDTDPGIEYNYIDYEDEGVA